MSLAKDLKSISEYPMVALPYRPMKFSIGHWLEANADDYRTITAHQKLAGRVISEAERVIDETAESALTGKLEVDHQLQVKIKDIEFRKNQLEWQKKEIEKEVDCLRVYMLRIIDAQKNLGHQALETVRKCLILRDGRVGQDLVADEVDSELRQEERMITSVQDMLIRLKEQVKEQTRRLKATLYVISRDLEDKSNVVSIDQHNLSLNEHSTALSIYHGSLRLDPATITEEEWSSHSSNAIKTAEQELASARPLRAYIDAILKQVIEDLWKQYDIVNSAFARRIQDIREQKIKMENHHFETVRLINELTLKINGLEKSLAEKESFVALAHTRLGNRCQRSNVELCRDEAETYLVNEVYQLKMDTIKIQQMLSEANATQRYLLRTQVQIEENINVKTNSLKIDEVDCMNARASMDYHAY